jgi:Ca-activated chloride channel homolog
LEVSKLRSSIAALTFANLFLLFQYALFMNDWPLVGLAQSNWAMALPRATGNCFKLSNDCFALSSVHQSGSLIATDTNWNNLGPCPLKHTSVRAQISGYAARVTVEQVFVNPYPESIEAVYTFPLSDFSAVDEMKMEIGKRVIFGSIQKKDEAQKTYLKAKQEGHAAALLEQQRVNVFTQSVTNIPPRSTVKILIKYTEILSFESGSYSFVFPFVVGPRYMPGKEHGHSGTGSAPDTAVVPDGSKISPPMAATWSRAGHDVSLDVDINSGMPIADISSKLHKVEMLKTSPNTVHISIARQDRIPNKDFVLTWRVGAEAIKSGYLTNRKAVEGGQDGFFSLMVMPPAKPAVSQISPRELNFIIDRSGSQFGRPLQKAKETVLYVLNHMRAGDTFQIFSFSRATEQLFARPQPAVPATIAEAKKYIDAMESDGGTEMRRAVEVATSAPAPANRLRIIALMTDGLIGNDNEIIELVRRTRGTARWFPFGTGDSVNRNLIDGIASAGGGEADYVLLDSPGDVVAKKFLDKIDRPVLTDLKVKFKGVEVSDVEPSVINDVWAQRPIYLTGKYRGPAAGSVEISGFSGGKPYYKEMPLLFPAENSNNTILPALWARAKVEELSHATHDRSAPKESDQKKAIEVLGLKYHLLTDFTSFVAVDNSKNIVDTAVRTIAVPVESPTGIETSGQSKRSRARRASSFSDRQDYFQRHPWSSQAFQADIWEGQPSNLPIRPGANDNTIPQQPKSGRGGVNSWQGSTKAVSVHVRCLGSSSSTTVSSSASSPNSAKMNVPPSEIHEMEDALEHRKLKARAKAEAEKDEITHLAHIAGMVRANAAGVASWELRGRNAADEQVHEGRMNQGGTADIGKKNDSQSRQVPIGAAIGHLAGGTMRGGVTEGHLQSNTIHVAHKVNAEPIGVSTAHIAPCRKNQKAQSDVGSAGQHGQRQDSADLAAHGECGLGQTEPASLYLATPSRLSFQGRSSTVMHGSTATTTPADSIKRYSKCGGSEFCQSVTMSTGAPVPPEVTIISSLDVSSDREMNATETGDKKLDVEVLKSLALVKGSTSGGAKLKLALLVASTDPAFLDQLKGLSVEVLKVSENEIIVSASVGRVRDIAQLTTVLKIVLAKE